jgi:predicted nucleic acid-binding protein
MIVVTNTSPLTNLAAIGQFDLLRHLYRRVHVAEGVWEELNAQGRHWPGRDQVAQADWVERCTVQNRDLVLALERDLDHGEAQTIALALELGADLVLLDEQEGRHAAQRFGLHVVGVVGILLEAKAKGAIHTMRPHLDALRQTAGFYVSASLYERALELANEADEKER